MIVIAWSHGPLAEALGLKTWRELTRGNPVCCVAFRNRDSVTCHKRDNQIVQPFTRNACNCKSEEATQAVLSRIHDQSAAGPQRNRDRQKGYGGQYVGE